ADNQTAVDIHVMQGEREMAAGNITLGRFQLTGIAPAPRGIPQIEVTFDIDANGIVNVSAKDLGTGKEQAITFTSSTNLTDEEINQKVKEAEQYAAEDAKRKQQVEDRNKAETLVYETEKNLKDLEGKLDESERSGLESAKEDLKAALEANNPDDIKAKTDALEEKFHALASKIYQQQGAAGAGPDMSGFAGGAGPNMGGAAGPNMGGQAGPAGNDDNVVDADFTVVDDDNK
ncbi:MAG: Hsp70 family protein, partial [Eubacterium sp.]|nr:Hsp70 family protein [Eubacterium sp.]